MTNPTLQRAMKAIDGTVDFRDGWMTPENAERTVRAVLMAVREPGKDVIDTMDEHALQPSEWIWEAAINAILYNKDGDEPPLTD